MPIAAVEQQADHHQVPMNPYSEFLLRTAERFGVPTVLCLLILWWAKTGIVQPLMDSHFSFINRIVDSQERHTDALGEIGDKLDTLISLTRHAAEKAKTN